MITNRAARRCGNNRRAYTSGSVQNPTYILSKYEVATLAAGLCVAVSFGLMFIYAAVMF